MTVEQLDSIFKSISDMSPEDLSALVRKALDDANIPYETGKSHVVFDGLSSQTKQ